MPSFSITIKNYRAFPIHAPVTFNVSEGITFLLGVNNVGKSALMRSFFELRPAINHDELRNAIGRDKNYRAGLKKPFDEIANRENPTAPITMDITVDGNGWHMEMSPEGSDPHTQTFSIKTTPIGSASLETVELIVALFQRSMYVGPFRSPAVQVSGTLYDIEVGHQFVGRWDAWANGDRIDHNRQVNKLIRELKELFGFRDFDISVSQSTDRLYITTEEGRFSLSELGDGIAHYIIVLGNAMIREPTFIFIDEPEIGLHPRMQEVFVRTLASKARYGLAATSHSVGLARSVADRVLTITRERDGARRCLPFGEHRTESLIQSIAELGYSQYAELGGNNLLLVEGRKDIKAFREILRKFKLDQHFIIWSLNGSEWLRMPKEKIEDELAELKRLNPASISVIFDSERTNTSASFNPAFQQFYDVCVELSFNVFPTDRHSTENYITQAALDKAIPGAIALEPFEPFGSRNPKWDKTKNWLAFREMSREDLIGTGLNDFLVDTLSPLAKA